jgi:hypothetical protein
MSPRLISVPSTASPRTFLRNPHSAFRQQPPSYRQPDPQSSNPRPLRGANTSSLGQHCRGGVENPKSGNLLSQRENNIWDNGIGAGWEPIESIRVNSSSGILVSRLVGFSLRIAQNGNHLRAACASVVKQERLIQRSQSTFRSPFFGFFRVFRVFLAFSGPLPSAAPTNPPSAIRNPQRLRILSILLKIIVPPSEKFSRVFLRLFAAQIPRFSGVGGYQKVGTKSRRCPGNRMEAGSGHISAREDPFAWHPIRVASGTHSPHPCLFSTFYRRKSLISHFSQ